MQIPRDCERLAARVPLPDLARDRGNAKLGLLHHRAGLIEANGNLDATRQCQQNQRERFSGGAP